MNKRLKSISPLEVKRIRNILLVKNIPRNGDNQAYERAKKLIPKMRTKLKYDDIIAIIVDWTMV